MWRYQLQPMTMEMLYDTMNERFSPWKIVFPRDEFMNRQPHDKHYTASWTVKYSFGKDQWGEYLDLYKNHRHPGSSFYRLYWTTGKMFNCITYEEEQAFRFNQTDKINEYLATAKPPLVGFVHGIGPNPL